MPGSNFTLRPEVLTPKNSFKSVSCVQFPPRSPLTYNRFSWQWAAVVAKMVTPPHIANKTSDLSFVFISSAGFLLADSDKFSERRCQPSFLEGASTASTAARVRHSSKPLGPRGQPLKG